MATWTTTEQTVTWTAVDDPSVTWAVNVNPTVVGAGGLTEAEVNALIDSYHLPFNATTRAHVPVSNFGGTVGGGTATIAAFAGIPAGRTLWLEGQTDPADDGFYTAEGAGVFTLSDVQPLGSATYVGREVVVGVDSEFGFAPSLWVITSDGVTIEATRSAVRPDQLTTILGDYALAEDLTDYALATDLTSGLAAASRATTIGDVRQAHADALLAGITNVFRCDGGPNGRWSTPNLTGDFTTGVSVRTLMIPRRPSSLPFFAETVTQPHDAGAGSWDNFEQAVFWSDGAGGDITSEPDHVPLEGRPDLFWEQTEDSGITDGDGLFVDCLLASDQPVEVMTVVTFGTSTAQHWLRVPYELDDGGTYHTDADDGAIFRLMGSKVSAKFASIDAHTEEWWLGNNFVGDIVRVIVRDGLDGTLIANPDANTETVGASSFTDGAGNTWTAGSAADIVALEPIATVDAVSNVTGPTILGKVTGTGDSEELTATQVRTLLGQGWVQLADQTVASGGVASISVDVTGYTMVRVLFAGNSERASAQDSLRMTFNNDTSSVYSTDSGSLTTFLNLASPPGQLTNADRGGWCEAEVHLLEGFTKSGVSRSTNIGSTAAVGQSVVHRGLFSTITAAVTSIELLMANADIAAGSRLIVLGQ